MFAEQLNFPVSFKKFREAREHNNMSHIAVSRWIFHRNYLYRVIALNKLNRASKLQSLEAKLISDILNSTLTLDENGCETEIHRLKEELEKLKNPDPDERSEEEKSERNTLKSKIVEKLNENRELYENEVTKSVTLHRDSYVFGNRPTEVCEKMMQNLQTIALNDIIDVTLDRITVDRNARYGGYLWGKGSSFAAGATVGGVGGIGGGICVGMAETIAIGIGTAVCSGIVLCGVVLGGTAILLKADKFDDDTYKKLFEEVFHNFSSDITINKIVDDFSSNMKENSDIGRNIKIKMQIIEAITTKFRDGRVQPDSLVNKIRNLQHNTEALEKEIGEEMKSLNEKMANIPSEYMLDNRARRYCKIEKKFITESKNADNAGSDGAGTSSSSSSLGYIGP